MKGYILNPDKKYVEKIIEGIYRKDGHCPCRINVDDTTLCQCDEFIENQVEILINLSWLSWFMIQEGNDIEVYFYDSY